jgi:hypothetical protein
MELFHIDVLCLQDVRLFANEARRLKKHAAAMLGPGCLIKASILTPHPDPETLRQSNRVGGQLLIVSPRWGRRCVSSWTDDSGLGLAVGWSDLCPWTTTHSTYQLLLAHSQR